jgi:2-methylisocitrate lyase-like PEP mutase family enzyme
VRLHARPISATSPSVNPSDAVAARRRLPSGKIHDVADLAARCERLRSLHVPGDPLVLPNAWDAASARAVAAAGFPVVATTSAGVAEALGYEDHERAPAGEMLAAAGRICESVDVPVTVDAEAGYGMDPEELVAALAGIGAAGCNLEDTEHASGGLRDAEEQADWIRAVRKAASAAGYPLVLNARIDVFLSGGAQDGLVGEALERARAYAAAGADCVYPILLSERGPLEDFVAGAAGPVNVYAREGTPSLSELAALGVARVSYGPLLYRGAMDGLALTLGSIARVAFGS